MTQQEEQRQRQLEVESAPDSDKANKDSKENSKAELRWPFPIGSQNNTDKAVKLKPYVAPKRRSLNQY